MRLAAILSLVESQNMGTIDRKKGKEHANCTHSDGHPWDCRNGSGGRSADDAAVQIGLEIEVQVRLDAGRFQEGLLRDNEEREELRSRSSILGGSNNER
jgi:hypothetical protein